MKQHPELHVINSPGWVEYRIENWHVARDGSGRIIRGNAYTWLDGVIIAAIAIFCSKSQGNTHGLTAIMVLLFLFVYSKCTAVVWESVIALPPHGVQLETHRGLPSFPIFASRRFIPMTALQDIIINEGLRRWEIRYYLAFIVKEPNGDFELAVAYENILPHFPLLLEIYHSLKKNLYPNTEFTQFNNDST